VHYKCPFFDKFYSCFAALSINGLKITLSIVEDPCLGSHSSEMKGGGVVPVNNDQ